MAYNATFVRKITIYDTNLYESSLRVSKIDFPRVGRNLYKLRCSNCNEDRQQRARRDNPWPRRNQRQASSFPGVEVSGASRPATLRCILYGSDTGLSLLGDALSGRVAGAGRVVALMRGRSRCASMRMYAHSRPEDACARKRTVPPLTLAKSISVSSCEYIGEVTSLAGEEFLGYIKHLLV